VGLWPWVFGAVVGLPTWVCGCGSLAWVFLWLLFGLFGDLSLFCQNKLGDVSPCDWMLQKTPFADGSHGRGSLIIIIIIIIIIISHILFN
jgi:hypothetical protein